MATVNPSQSMLHIDMHHIDHAVISMAEHLASHDDLMVIICRDHEQLFQWQSAIKTFCSSPCVTFPDTGVLAYDRFSPSSQITCDRLNALKCISKLSSGIVLSTFANSLRYTLPYDSFHASHHDYQVGMQVNIKTMVKQWDSAGFRRVPRVENPGEYCIKGSVIDVFVPAENMAVRIDFFDETIDSIRQFDPTNQQSARPINRLTIELASECLLTQENIKHFRHQWREHFGADATNHPVYQTISMGHNIATMEQFLPWFYPKPGTLYDYIDKNAYLYIPDIWETLHANKLADLHRRFDAHITSAHQKAIKPESLMIDASTFSNILASFDHRFMTSSKSPSLSQTLIESLQINGPKTVSCQGIADWLAHDKHRQIIIGSSHLGQRQTMSYLLADHGIAYQEAENWKQACQIDVPCMLLNGDFASGALLENPTRILIMAHTLMGKKEHRYHTKHTHKNTNQSIIDHHRISLADLKIGDFLVHQDYGIGAYQGLVQLDPKKPDEFIKIAYLNDDIIYLPMQNIHLLSVYVADGQSPPQRSALGNKQWQKKQAKIKKSIEQQAVVLAKLYASANKVKPYAYRVNPVEYANFSAAFSYTETPDQACAITAIEADLASHNKRLERLLCADVGFGKTEVAMRAAFIVASQGHQVAVLAPTGLLARQHYQQFIQRFYGTALNITLYCGKLKTQEDQYIRSQCKSGQIDIIIGTHKLIKSRLDFAYLGLLVVDEEHRFGQHDKDQLRQLSPSINILSMTATPIPRTLHMALASIRDLSIINTPPENRLPVKTILSVKSQHIIQEAIDRELSRGGQIFYVYNDVRTMPKAFATLSESLKKHTHAAYLHGQMPQTQIDSIMHDFIDKRTHVLMASTIIESGIDIPSANTIIIDQADRFGIADLHQLRGRVGRSHQQAYCYLLIDQEPLSEQAATRLNTIMTHQALGSGFQLALNDLDMRGAGELLGKAQSGHMQTIGLSLYMSMLEQAMQSSEKQETKQRRCTIDHQINAFIPKTYMIRAQDRMDWYQQLDSAVDDASIMSKAANMIDQFGLAPQPVKSWIDILRIRCLATSMGISSIKQGKLAWLLDIDPPYTINVDHLLSLIAHKKHGIDMAGNDRIRIAHINANAPELTHLYTTIKVIADLS